MPRAADARFAFLVHPTVPLQRAFVVARARKWDLLVGLRGPRLDDAHRVCRIGLDFGRGRVEGVVSSVPLLPDELLEDQERAVDWMVRAVEATEGGVDAVGLGSLLAVVAGRGTGLQRRLWQPVTTGAAATAWASAENAVSVARALGTWPSGPIAVLGYNGSVGEAVAAWLRERGARDLRVDARGPAARRASSLGLAALKSPAEAVRGARVVVGASTTGGILRPGELEPGTVLLDAALPPTVEGRPPPGVTVLSAEALALPATYRRGAWGRLYHLVAGYGPRHLFACVVEPLLVAAEALGEPLAQGRRVPLRSLERVAELALKYGFRPALLRGWRELPPEALRERE